MRYLNSSSQKTLKKFLSQILCNNFKRSKFSFLNEFQNRNYASVELENHFQSVKSWFSVVLRDEMIWRKISFNSPLYSKNIIFTLFPKILPQKMKLVILIDLILYKKQCKGSYAIVSVSVHNSVHYLYEFYSNSHFFKFISFFKKRFVTPEFWCRIITLQLE